MEPEVGLPSSIMEMSRFGLSLLPPMLTSEGGVGGNMRGKDDDMGESWYGSDIRRN